MIPKKKKNSKAQKKKKDSKMTKTEVHRSGTGGPYIHYGSKHKSVRIYAFLAMSVALLFDLTQNRREMIY